MWKNVVRRGRPQMTIWRMRVACWIPKATNTLTLCNTYCSSTTKMVARTCLSVTLYILVHGLSCYTLSSGLQKLAEKMSYGWLQRFVSYHPQATNCICNLVILPPPPPPPPAVVFFNLKCHNECHLFRRYLKTHLSGTILSGATVDSTQNLTLPRYWHYW